jgi:hypothetical protein
MRFTFVILLFLSLGADAQMIIKAHPNYVPFASANLLLDDYSNAAAAYSIRKLRTAYSGNCIRVRRSNDNTEQDIGFTGNELDTSSLKTFVGANSGFIVRWLDQSGNGYNLGQATAASQPRIINAGVIDRQNGKVCIVFDGSNDALINGSNINISGDITESVFLSIKQNTTTGLQALFSHGANASLNAFSLWSNLRSTNQYEVAYIGNDYRTDKSTNTNFQLISLIKTPGAINTTTKIWFNAVQASDRGGSSTSTPNVSNTGLNLCRNVIGSSTTGNASANVTEFIIYSSDQTSNRTGIETNINSYYGIY